MLHEIVLDKITTDGSGKFAKVYNGRFFSPLVLHPQKGIIELDSIQMINVPIFSEVAILKQDLDLLLIQLIRYSKRSTRFDVLNSEDQNVKTFIEKAVGEFKRKDGTPVRKIAVIGKDLEVLRKPFDLLLKTFEYVEFLDGYDFPNEIILVPIEEFSGAVVYQGVGKKNVGIVLYEECIKKLVFYNDNDLKNIMNMLKSLEDQGDL